MQHTASKLVILGAAFATIVGITVLITGQPTSKLSLQPASSHRIGVPDDWSHHHLVFSNPGTYEQAAKTSASYAKWLTIRYHTRFILQQMKRHAEGFSPEMTTGGKGAFPPSGVVQPAYLTIGLLRQLPGEAIAQWGPKPKPQPKPKPKPKPKHVPFKMDWGEPLLLTGTTGMVQPNAYPAKWGASLTSASCSDFVVYPTGTAGALTGGAPIVAYNELYGTTGPDEQTAGTGCGATIGVTVPSVYWADFTYGTFYPDYEGGSGAAIVSTSPIISLDGSQVAFIQSNGAVSSLVLMRMGPGGTVAAPETAIFETNGGYRSYDQLPCFTLVGTPAVGAYEFESDTFSAPFYDYASDDAIYVGDDAGYLHKFTGVFYGTPTWDEDLWPVLLAGRTVTGSLSGSTVTLTSGTFTLADVGATIWGTVIPGGGYTIASLVGGAPYTTANLTTTAPTPEPSETLTISTAKLTSPVYDPVSGNIFVGDTGGYFYAVNSTTGDVTKSAKLGDVIIDAPLVDSSAGMAYVFVTTNNDTTTPSNAVFQFYTTTGTTIGTFTSGSSGNNGPNGIEVGAGGAGYYLYAGDFDNVYYQSSDHTGNLYVVGNTGATSGGTLYQIPITNNSMGSATGVTTVTGATSPWPSPLTEFCNNGGRECEVTTGEPCPDGVTCTSSGTDYLLFSVNQGNKTGCTASSTNGCVLSYNITTPSSISQSGSGLNVTNASGSSDGGCWATGGIVIDNSDTTTTGASQVYFLGLNGSIAGGAIAPTSSKCGTFTTTIINATQASQSSP